MNENEASLSGRALADIESDLVKAEKAFVDADARFTQAERDRRTALDTINKHQTELDSAISELRQRSIAGSRWDLDVGEEEDTLNLQPEDIVEDEDENESKPDSLLSRDTKQVLAADFERLRASTQGQDRDTVLKVAVGERN